MAVWTGVLLLFVHGWWRSQRLPAPGGHSSPWVLLLTPALPAGSDEDDPLTQLPERLTISPPHHQLDRVTCVMAGGPCSQSRLQPSQRWPLIRLIPGKQPIYPVSRLLDRSAGSSPSGVHTLGLWVCVGADAHSEASSALATAPGLDRGLRATPHPSQRLEILNFQLPPHPPRSPASVWRRSCRGVRGWLEREWRLMNNPFDTLLQAKEGKIDWTLMRIISRGCVHLQ